MTYTQIRNITGINDDAELNAACECERRDEMAERIAEAIVKSHGYYRGLYNGDVFKFDKVCEVLAEFGFKYIKADEDDECHFFFNKETNDDIHIWPVTFYPKQGDMRFENFLLS